MVRVVVPGYYLVWYNGYIVSLNAVESQFPVITWYGIMFGMEITDICQSQFPVITWYGIIYRAYFLIPEKSQFPVITWYGIISLQQFLCVGKSQFPVITWYGIIARALSASALGRSSRLLLGMV